MWLWNLDLLLLLLMEKMLSYKLIIAQREFVGDAKRAKRA